MERASAEHTSGKKFVGVWLDSKLAEQLLARAARQDRSLSATIRVALRQALAD